MRVDDSLTSPVKDKVTKDEVAYHKHKGKKSDALPQVDILLHTGVAGINDGGHRQMHDAFLYPSSVHDYVDNHNLRDAEHGKRSDM